MDTALSIYLTQIPIALGIFIGAYQLYRISGILDKILRKTKK